MKSNAEIVLNCLLNGMDVSINNKIYRLNDQQDLLVQMKDISTNKIIWMKLDLSFKDFLKMCNNMAEPTRQSLITKLTLNKE